VRKRENQPSNIYSLPAPIGGLNTRDPIEVMPETDARILINWFPDTNKIAVRKGYVSYIASGIDSAKIDLLVELSLESGTRKLLACTNNKIFDCSTSTATSLATGFGTSKFVPIVFRNRIFLFNGINTPRIYDGSTIESVNFTGVTLENLKGGCSYKNRLYLIEKNSGKIWYGGVNQVTGALTEFDVSSLFTLGGSILTCLDTSKETGVGEISQFVIISENGEVLIYQGLNPSDASWVLVRRSIIPKPLNSNCVKTFGSDIIILTATGLYTLNTLMNEGIVGKAYSITDKLNEGLKDSIAKHASIGNVEVFFASKVQRLYINIPTSASTAFQYVINTETGAGCLFSNMNANTWGVFNNDIYFGGFTGNIFKTEIGLNDAGSPIPIDIITAPIYMGDRINRKRFLQTKVNLLVTSPASIKYGIDGDFNLPNLDYELVANAVVTPWSTGTTLSPIIATPWESSWSDELKRFNSWVTTPASGINGTLRVSGFAFGTGIEISSYDFRYKIGGLI
jgi:hypothetical protein